MTTLPRNEARKPGLTARVIRFADFLKFRGFRVFQSSVQDALRSLEAIDLAGREDFLAALRGNLVSNDLEWKQFDGLFEEFWGKEGDSDPRRDEGEGKRQKEQSKPSISEKVSDVDSATASTTEHQEEKGRLEGAIYSPVSILEEKDLGRYKATDVQAAWLALKKLIEPFRVQVSRRRKRGRKPGRLDVSRTLRRSVKTGGTPFEIFFMEKKKRLKRLLILADVSGSMDRYARFVMPFLLGLRGAGPGTEVFVFSTSLGSVTSLVRHLSIDKALERMARDFPEWSGGTRIGYSLHQLNEREGRRLLTRRTVVIILSDGWDLGGKELLKREMAALRRKAYCVIWLNPLAGKPEYDPLCQGMRIALPYVDHFLPADNLKSLKRVGRLVSRIMTR